jgi:lipopolysaccharide cholinephosphotransferase
MNKKFIIPLSCFIVVIILSGLIIHHFTKKLKPYQLLYVHKILKNMLGTFISLLHKHNYSYFIQGGTLLGAVRHKNIISHDDDIDLGMLDNDLHNILNDKLFMDDLKSHNLKITKSYHCYKIKYIKFKNNSNIFIDLFSYSKLNNNIIHYSQKRTRNNWKNGWFNYNELYPLKIYYLDNVLVYGPQNPTPYFERHFGKNWEIPISTHGHAYIFNMDDDCDGECFDF